MGRGGGGDVDLLAGARSDAPKHRCVGGASSRRLEPIERAGTEDRGPTRIIISIRASPGISRMAWIGAPGDGAGAAAAWL